MAVFCGILSILEVCWQEGMRQDLIVAQIQALVAGAGQ